MPSNQQDQEFLYLFPSAISTDAGGALSLQWPDAAGAFSQRRPLAVNASLPTIQWHPGALSPDECRQVIELGESLPRTDGRVELGPDAYRVSHIAWIAPRPDNHWLFHKLAMLFAQANRHYGFELTGFIDALQYTKYGPEQHFEWHLDVGMDRTSARKLSMTLQLSGPSDYTGGALEFISAATGDEARQLGSATFFPAYLAHRVSPVQSGVRRSLVAWAYGPAFR
jgi:PKHD-type hydroxylase